MSKTAWLYRQTSGDLRYDELRLDDIATRQYGACAVTTARWNARGTAQGHPIPETTRLTLISVREHGDWRMAGSTSASSPVPRRTGRPSPPRAS
jgi:hypothetical protein